MNEQNAFVTNELACEAQQILLLRVLVVGLWLKYLKFESS